MAGVTLQELGAQESSINDSIDVAPEARFECPICLAWLRDPVLTSCGHRFCRNCIQSWLEKDNHDFCPVDNMKLQKDHDIFPDNFTRREISQQRTKCPNIIRGCLIELSPLDVDSHLLECEYRIRESHLPDNEKIRCQFVDVGCDEKFEDQPSLEQHMAADIHKHLMLLSKVYRDFNIKNEASASASAIAEQANFWDPPSKNPQEIAEPSSSNNSSTSKAYQDLLKALYEKIVILEQKNREQEIIISNLSQQMTSISSSVSLRTCGGAYVWPITDFKQKLTTMMNNNYMMYYSPGFYTSYYGYKICIRMNLCSHNSSYVALLVHLMKSEHDNTLDWPFNGRITICIVHPTIEDRTVKETMMTRPELDAFKRPTQEINAKGYGYTEFILLDDLRSQGFVIDNKLIVKVSCQPV